MVRQACRKCGWEVALASAMPQDCDGQTSLHKAVAAGHDRIAALL